MESALTDPELERLARRLAQNPNTDALSLEAVVNSFSPCPFYYLSRPKLEITSVG
jgi:hypothetical protein